MDWCRKVYLFIIKLMPLRWLKRVDSFLNYFFLFFIFFVLVGDEGKYIEQLVEVVCWSSKFDRMLRP